MAALINELWVLHGFNWSLPIWVCKMDMVMRVRRAGNVTALMCEALEKRLSELGTSNGQDWFLTKEVLERHADLILRNGSGMSADDCISWIRPVGRTVWMDQPKEMEGFYEDLVRDGFCESPQAAQTLYTAVCQRMLDRLASKRRPVDLGFAQLEPLPLRPDWRDLVLDRSSRNLIDGVEKNWHTAFGKSLGWLSLKRLLMYAKNSDTLLWSINLKHKKPWWRTLRAVERDRRKTNHSIKYFLETLDFLKEKKDEILGLLLDYVSQTRRPFVELRKGDPYRNRIQKPQVRFIPAVRVRETRRQSFALDHRFGKKVGPKIVAFARARVRKMPNLQPGDADMRDGGRPVDTAGNAAGGAGGLPVLDSGQGVSPGG